MQRVFIFHKKISLIRKLRHGESARDVEYLIFFYFFLACIILSSSLLSVIFAFDHDPNFIRQVNVSISSSNNYCIEVVLRCLAVEGDGLGIHDMNDGGVLGTVMAAGFKGIKHY